MTCLLAVDPGIRGCGVAIFSIVSRNLLRAAYVKNLLTRGDGPEACRGMALAVEQWVRVLPFEAPLSEAVFEWPQVYSQGKSKGNPNDLLGLAGVDAAIATILACHTEYYLPREWKGQIDGDVMIKRIENRLFASEISTVVEFGHLTHNIMDAIGIGLHHLGRLSPRKVIVR